MQSYMLYSAQILVYGAGAVQERSRRVRHCVNNLNAHFLFASAAPQGLHVNHWTAHNKTGFYGRSAAKLRHRGKMQNSTDEPQNGGDSCPDKTC